MPPTGIERDHPRTDPALEPGCMAFRPTALRLPMALLVAGVLAACGAPAASSTSPTTAVRSTAPSASAEADEPSASPSSSAGAAVFTAEFDLGGGPDLPTAAFESMWILAADGPLMDGSPPMLHRLDPATGEVIASIELSGRQCQGIGASEDAMWACAEDELVRVDPATNEITARVPIDAPLGVSQLPYGDGTMWAFTTSGVGPDTVIRVDPSSATVVAEIPLGVVAGTMAYGHDALWVTSPTQDVLLRIDPATNTVERWAEEIEGAGLVRVGADGVWVSLHGEHAADPIEPSDPTLVKVDPATGDVVVEAATGGSLGVDGGFSVTDDAVWVRAPEPFLAVVDPVTGDVIRTIEQSGGGGDVAVALGSVWLTSHDRGTVWTLDPAP